MNKCIERIVNGIVKENPTFVMLIGMCPTLAVTTSAINGIGMGLSTTLVLVFSNLLISLLRKIIPDSARVPAFIVVVASLVTIVQFLLQGYVPSLYASLGIYIPLIVVNCIILGIGAVREILGSGQIFGFQLLPLADAAAGKAGFTPITIFVLAPGAFFVLAMLIAIQNAFREAKRKKGIAVKERTGCFDGDCAACASSCCEGKVFTAGTDEKE